MTTMEMAITALIEQPTEKKVKAARTTAWPLPALVAMALHVAAFALIFSAPSATPQAPLLAGESLPVTLYAALPAPIAGTQTAPAPATKIQPPTPEPVAAPQVVAPPVQPVSLAKAPRTVTKPQKKIVKSTAKPAPPVAVAQPQAQSSASSTSEKAFDATARTAKGGAAHAIIPARPRYRDNPPPAYPELARRRQMEGTVVLEALVNGNGRVDALNVHASSGYTLLDDTALRTVRKWLFVPGKKGDVPMSMSVLVPVRFALR